MITDCLFGLCETILGGLCDALYDCTCGLCSEMFSSCSCSSGNAGTSAGTSTSTQDWSALGPVLLYILLGVVVIIFAYQGFKAAQSSKLKKQKDLALAETKNAQMRALRVKKEAETTRQACISNESVAKTWWIVNDIPSKAPKALEDITEAFSRCVEVEGELDAIIQEELNDGGDFK